MGDTTLLVLVMFLWALCFPLIAFGLEMAPPLYFAALRSAVAGASLLFPAFLLRRPLPQCGNIWLSLLGVGIGFTSLGFGGMFLAGGLVNLGLATVLANVQPLLAAVLAYFVLAERVGQRGQLGLGVGFVGILLISLPSSQEEDANSSLLGMGYILLGASGVAVGNVLLKQIASQVDSLMATGWQFVLGSVPLFWTSWMFEGQAQVVWSMSFIIVLLALSLLGTAFASALWLLLLRRNKLNRANAFSFLTPIFALVIGVGFFDERLRLMETAGILLVLGNV